MSEQLLVVLRICLLILVYLVFLRVLRAVWVELKSGAAARPPARVVAAAAPAIVGAPGPAPSATSSPSRLVAVVSPTGAGQVYELGVENTIGRAAGCRIALDDSRVSKLHARVFEADGKWMVEDLGSTNGTALNEQMLTSTVALVAGDRIHVGETVLEFS